MTAFGMQSQSYDAVLFVQDDAVVKEMLYGEFEAVLDGVVGEPEYKGQTCEAVYLKLDTALTITAAVFFTIKFGRDGQADPYWNLPLVQMAETADLAMELGGKGIRVVCSSQCSTPWHQASLWEPDLSPESGLLSGLQTAIRANRLGFIVEQTPEPAEPELPDPRDMPARSNNNSGRPAQDVQTTLNGAIYDSQELQQEMLRLAEALGQNGGERTKAAGALKKLRLQMANLKQRHQQEIEIERANWAKEKELMAREVMDSSTELDKVRRKMSLMATSVASLKSQLAKQKEDFENTLASKLDANGAEYESIKESVRKEYLKQHQEQVQQLRDMLEMHRLELHYREGKIGELELELNSLRETHADNATNENEVLKHLAENDVHFVVSLPAIGAINIPHSQLSDYLVNTSRYLANRLGVDEERFEAWKNYSENPVCCEQIGNGSACGEQVNIVSPAEFIPGVSDRCSLHRIDQQPRLAVGS